MDRSDGSQAGADKTIATDKIERIEELLVRAGVKPNIIDGFDYGPYPGLEGSSPDLFEGEQSIQEVSEWDPLEHSYSEDAPVKDDAYYNKLVEMRAEFELTLADIKKYLQKPESRAEIEQLAKEYGFDTAEKCVAGIEKYLRFLPVERVKGL
jgi:hypothetical protein